MSEDAEIFLPGEGGMFGLLLVGGSSRRMSTPKQLLSHDGVSLAARAVEAMRPHVEQVVLAGSGPVPDELRGLHRLPDPPGVAGPIAGLLAAMRWAPGSAWVVAACDMPQISGEAVRWLLEQRRPGTWAVLPRPRSGRVEPLLAVYEPQSRLLLEAQAAAGRWGPRHLAENERVMCPTPPAELAGAWINVNTPEEMRDSLHSHV
jgi:molybdopterin-guanine dinucleotide biosynthesis protein A